MEIDRIKLRELRRSRQMTGVDLSDAIGISNQTLSRIENGLHVPSDKIIRKLAEFLKVPIESLCIPDAETQQNRLQLLAVYDTLNPIMQAAALSFVQGLQASNSPEASLLAAQVAVALETARRSAVGPESEPQLP